MTNATLTAPLLNRFHSKAALALLLGGGLLFSLPGEAAAQKASDLHCKGCVGSRDIGKGAVRSVDIKDGTISAADLADGVITFDKLAGDAVYTRVLVVSPPGGSTSDNCEEIRTALNSVTDAGPDNPYLLFLEPGTYDCGSDPIIMKPYVSLRGSGETLTHIIGSYDAFGLPSPKGLVSGASHSEISHLSITNGQDSIGSSVALDFYESEGSRLRGVFLTAKGATASNTGIHAVESDLRLENATLLAEGGGLAFGIVHITPKAMEMNNVSATASGSSTSSTGLIIDAQSNSNTLRMKSRNSSFAGQNFAVEVAGATLDKVLISTKLDGGVSAVLGASAICVNSYDETYNPVDRQCFSIP